MAKFYSFIFLLIFASTSVFSKATLKVPKDVNITATIEYTIAGYNIDTVYIDGNSYVSVTVDGLPATLLEKEKPQLPIDAVDVVLNGSENVKIVIDSIEYKTIKTLPPIPSKGNFTRNLRPSSIKHFKGEIYKKNEWYPTSNIIASKPFLIRSINGVALQIAPIQYNGIKGELRIAERIVFNVIEKGSSLRRVYREEKSKTFKNIFKSRFINYNETNLRSRTVNDGDEMIVITPQKYKSAVKDFVDWKNQKGIKTTVYIYPDETGADTNQIKSFIKNKYDNDGISYVTLIGDGEDIPAYMVSVDDQDYGSHLDSLVPGDPIYSMVSGNDLYPDIFIGRITAESESEVTTILNKIINYEKYPDPSASWYQKSVGIGSNEGGPTDADWIKDSIHSELIKYGYTTTDEIFQGDGKTESDFSSYINNGRGLINFMGHGDFEGFGFNGPFWYDTSYVAALTNGNKLPVVIPLACNFGQYLGRDGAAEYWLKNPNGGAVAITGSTPLMDWTPPQWAQVEMNRLITQEAYNSFGAYFYNGEMKMLDFSVYQGEKTVKTWVYFGDPSLQLFTKTPTSMSFNYSQNRNSFISVLGENDALVTLCNSSKEIIESKLVTSGRADFTFTASIGDTVTITATKRNRVPYIETFIVGDVSSVKKFHNDENLKVVKLTHNTMQLLAPQKGNYELEILGLNGRVLSKSSHRLSKGMQLVDLNSGNISSGMVIVKLSGEGKQVISKLVVRE